MNAVRVMIVDDHAAFSRAATSFLQDHCEESVIVVGTATDSDKAVTLAKNSRPQLVLLDLGMTNHVWQETIARLRTLLPEVHIIVLSLFEAKPYLRIARQVSADDCIA